MRYVFRMPSFPLLLDTGTALLALRTEEECEIRVAALSLSGHAPLPVIDATAEGFAYYPNLGMITPLTMKKDWRKAEIIALYNERKPPGAPTYARSLANRRLEAVVADIAGLLSDQA
jgi:hypothetical protein